MISKDAVWLITGCSKGLGRSIADEALRAGYRVVATARDPSTLAGFRKGAEDRALVLALDVTKPDEVAVAVKEAERHFGSVDVLVNNAGYGYVGAIEEGDEDGGPRPVRDGCVGAMVSHQSGAPRHAARGRGHVVNISSVGGMVTYPAVGFYHMAKFAVEAFSDTLAQELAPFGIGVTVVAPGAFRTDFRGAPCRIPHPAAGVRGNGRQGAGPGACRAWHAGERPGSRSASHHHRRGSGRAACAPHHRW